MHSMASNRRLIIAHSPLGSGSGLGSAGRAERPLREAVSVPAAAAASLPGVLPPPGHACE